jgi:molybdenum cofactor synthesis domain-containing protein
MAGFRAAVITASDKGSRGEREDLSGAKAEAMLLAAGIEVVRKAVLPDERGLLADALRGICDGGEADLVVTTGGTGLSPRDWTPEATLDVADRQVPGLAELMRAEGLKKTPRAALSRGVAAIRGRTLILNLPGSPKAVEESLSAALPVLGHGLEVLSGRGGECARS